MSANTNPTLDKFHHSITGDASKPKLVFLHGLMGFTLNWRKIAKAFEADYQILVYDQRGHGRTSVRPATGYAPEDYANDLKDIIDSLGWSKITLVGHSMGGRASYSFAAHHPDRVTRLVIEDIGPKTFGNETGITFTERMLDAVPVPFATKREARAWFDTEFPRIFAATKRKEVLAEYLYANITENDQGQAIWRFYEPGVRESIAAGRAVERWDDIESLTMPTLVMRGENSQDLPRELFEQMLALNPKITGVEISGAGHWIHSDKPEVFIEALRRFFNGEQLPQVL
jgi:pimeloyl-ACP methyl ester carboxylesterase